MNTRSLKLTIKISSCGLLDSANAIAALTAFETFPAHTAAVVDNETNCCRYVFRADKLNVLILVVFNDAEIIFGEVVDRVTFGILNRDAKDDEIDIHGQLEVPRGVSSLLAQCRRGESDQ